MPRNRAEFQVPPAVHEAVDQAIAATGQLGGRQDLEIARAAVSQLAPEPATLAARQAAERLVGVELGNRQS